MPTQPLSLAAFARLPAAGDNVAIVTRRIEAGTTVRLDAGCAALTHTVLEGHRFAVKPIVAGEPLLSWGFPFGTALRAIAPGEYVANESILAALRVRAVDGAVLPSAPNFSDVLQPYQLDEHKFRSAPSVELAARPRTFSGYRRPGRRGVGTRNTIVVLGTSSRTASFARLLALRLKSLARLHPAFDGVVAIAHTEGGGQAEPNNAAEVLRALAGFMVHPNVGAVLAVDHGTEPITNARLRTFMTEQGYPLDNVLHQFLSLRGGHAPAMATGEAILRGWLPSVAGLTRTDEPLCELRVALQCGGSDAFSGVSGNPLAGAVAHEVIRHGGSANLCETDEAFGGEAYLLQNVRDLPTARALLATLAGFRERLAWHGVTAESNPSGGNKLRGLYNISLKSLGAVHKKDPRTRLDRVIRYADRMDAPGFYFMDSPGNDLEGIAGQVAAGCNLFIFVTGNGSVTNFPFVPTVKVTTTTRRHNLLVNEMDVNAGRYLDGEPMPALAAEMFELLLATASGQRSKGEQAGHSQVSLWRNWRQSDTSQLQALQARPEPDGRPLPVISCSRTPSIQPFPVWVNRGQWATELVGLVMPTSMCSSQIAQMAVARLNEGRMKHVWGVDRFVALAHTEGCGFGGESMHRLLHRTYRGYAMHPNVGSALFLEHGCEKIPNDVMRHQLISAGVDPERFGWASVQLDGGIAKALTRIETWFSGNLAGQPRNRASATAGLGVLNLGIMSAGPVGPATIAALVAVVHAIVAKGGSVLLPETDSLLANPAFCAALLGNSVPHATLAYGEPVEQAGLHVVATETEHWVENLTGLGGCGVHLFLTVAADAAQPGHPFLPVIQVAEASGGGALCGDDIDAFLPADPEAAQAQLLRVVEDVLLRRYVPKAGTQGFTDFQLTRGLLGVSA